MSTYQLSEVSGFFGLTDQQLRDRLSALRPLLQANGKLSQNEEIIELDDYGLKLLCYLDKLILEESTKSVKDVEVGRATHSVVGRE